MLKLLKIAVILVFLGGILCSSRTTAADKVFSESVKVKAGELISSSGSLYATNCARCHGADGKGNTELGQLYDASDLTSRRVQRKSRKSMTSVIRNGKGSMPGFGKKLSAKEISSLVTYIRTL